MLPARSGNPINSSGTMRHLIRKKPGKSAFLVIARAANAWSIPHRQPAYGTSLKSSILKPTEEIAVSRYLEPRYTETISSRIHGVRNPPFFKRMDWSKLSYSIQLNFIIKKCPFRDS